MDPDDLLDHVDLPRDVAGAPGRNGDDPGALLDLEAEPLQDPALLDERDLEPGDGVGPLRPQPRHRRHLEVALHVDLAGIARLRQLDEQLRRVDRGLLGDVRVDALLPAVRALGAQREPLRGAHDPDRLEVRGLEQDVRGVVGKLGLLAAHDPGERDRALGVGDHEIGRVELAQLAVERANLLPRLRPPDDDPALGEPAAIERVQRAAEREHHVVGDVDRVRDRPLAGGRQPRLHPLGRGADPRVVEEPADVARAARRVVHAHLYRLRVDRAVRLAAGHRLQLGVEDGRDLAGDPVDREQVGAVEARLRLDHLLAERQDFGQRRAGVDRLAEHDDPRVVGADLELALGEDHPVRHDAAELRLLELLTTGHHGAGQCDRDVRAGAEVPGATDDLARLPLSDVDRAELQPVGVRVLAGLEHEPDAVEAEVAVDVRHAAVRDPLELEGRDRQPLADLAGRGVDLDVLAQPGDGDLHQNCRRSRRSFSQSARRSGIPCRSIAMRSSPRPNANPDTSSAS